VVLEALRVDHEWASRRFHAFVLDGMRDNQAAMARQPGVTYYPYLEPCRGAARGLVDALAASAAVVVTDEFPAFFLPAMVERVGRRLDVSLETVDSYGLLPLRAFDRAFGTAQAFRRAWQGALASHLAEGPARDPWADPLAITPWRLPAEIAGRWPDVFTWLDSGHRLDDVPVDHAVGATPLRGGAAAAQARLTAFVAEDLAAYGEGRNDPDRDRSSGLSPYLHWGHIGAHEVFERLIAHEGWLGHLPSRATGAREGWWGMSPAAESFLDELVTWREIGGNMSVLRPHDYDRYESLPSSVRTTTTATNRCRRGPASRWIATPPIRAIRCTSSMPSSARRPTTRSGTRRSGSWCATGASTITCGCSGARRSCNGRPRRARRWR
jgi:deoxyribodipyrimidine photo-lyase